MEHLTEVGVELGFEPAGQLLTYKLFKDMLGGKYTPIFGLGDTLVGEYHKGEYH